MKPVDMIVKHAPPESIGDCFRCCIASLLELPAEEVPHFMADDWGKEKDFTWFVRLHDFLRPRGFAYIDLQVTPENHGIWFAGIASGGFEVFHVLSGMSPRAEHAVVARNGVMVHDPAPQKDGLIGPGKDGFYSYGMLVHRGGA